jgi:hypothetical protein
MKYFYIVIDTQNSDGKRCAYVRRFSDHDNIAFAITITPGVISATIASTKKDAYRIANTWNAVYIANGEYIY